MTPNADGTPAADTNGAGPARVGERLRSERQRQQIGLRELARQINVSASLISQVERGKSTPSVATLYAITTVLGLSLDDVFSGRSPPQAHGMDAGPSARAPGYTVGKIPTSSPVVRHNERQSLQLGSGVRWERMTSPADEDVDFLHVTYDAGGASCPADALIRHAGHEYGHVLQGRLHVTVGFETYTLDPGDSVSFASSMPHRLFNDGSDPVEAVWFVVGRRGDPRLGPR